MVLTYYVRPLGECRQLVFREKQEINLPAILGKRDANGLQTVELSATENPPLRRAKAIDQ